MSTHGPSLSATNFNTTQILANLGDKMFKIALGVISILSLGAGAAAAEEGSWGGGYAGVLAGASRSTPYGYYHGYFFNQNGNQVVAGSPTTPAPATPTPTPSPTPSPAAPDTTTTTTTTTTTPPPPPNTTTGSGAAAPTGYISYNINQQFTDANVALAGGYNIQRGHWVAGVDGDIGYIGGSGGIQSIDPGGSGRYDRLKLDWGGHFRGRVGRDMGGWLPYAAAGVVFDDVFASHFGISPASLTTPMTWSQKSVRVGWTVGVGVDKQLANGWAFRAEYLRDYLGKQTYQWVQDQLFSYTSINIDTLRVGVIKRF
jgi:opacity protein-like surface antigen